MEAVGRLRGGGHPLFGGGVKGALLSVAWRPHPRRTEASHCTEISFTSHGDRTRAALHFRKHCLAPGAQTSERQKVSRVRSGETEPSRWGNLGCRVSLGGLNGLALPPHWAAGWAPRV